MRRVLPALVLAALALGCRTSTAPTIPLTVTIESSTTTVARGDTVTFTVTAAGNNLFGVVIEYGDMGTDQYATGGAHSARITFKHAWEVAGSYTVRAVATDAFLGDREATVNLVVN